MKITVLGSSGSIGRQALDVIAAHPDQMEVYGLSVHADTERLIEQARRFHPKAVACSVPFDTSLLPEGTKALIGPDAAEELAADAEPDALVNGISGFAALKPLLASLKAGKRVALANKESIVCGNRFVDAALAGSGAEILPVDSEQSAIFPCLSNGKREEVSKLILTASGGPFRKMPIEQMREITPEQALRHPTWNMGRKITIDSATMFNKGLEVMEAGYLFHFPAGSISVLIHPQSIVHSMVSFRDGTVMANLANPDMRLPIQYALTYPDRIESPCRTLDLASAGTLEFFEVDGERFPAVPMAFRCLEKGGAAPIAYNGANEAAVEAFCKGELGFLAIADAVAYTLSRQESGKVSALEDVFEIDRESRRICRDYIQRKGSH